MGLTACTDGLWIGFIKMMTANRWVGGTVAVEGRRRRLGVIAATALFFAGTTLPAVAQMTELPQAAPKVSPTATASGLRAGTLSEADLEQIVAAVVAQETAQWTKEEKAVMTAVMELPVDGAYLMKLSELSESDLLKAVKNDEKLSALKAVPMSDQAANKVLPAVAVRLAAWTGARLVSEVTGSVVTDLIQLSLPNMLSMFNALRVGDVGEFRSLLSEAFTSRSFVTVVGTAASSFCDTATVGTTPKTCRAFTSAAQSAFRQARGRFMQNSESSSQSNGTSPRRRLLRFRASENADKRAVRNTVLAAPEPVTNPGK